MGDGYLLQSIGPLSSCAKYTKGMYNGEHLYSAFQHIRAQSALTPYTSKD